MSYLSERMSPQHCVAQYFIPLSCQRRHKHKQGAMIVVFISCWPDGREWHNSILQSVPTEILVRPKRVSGDNPVFLDPLTCRHLVVLARSWSCQRSIYGRSVFNLQNWTLPENRGRTKRRVSGGKEARTFVWMQSGSAFSGHCGEW